MDNSVKQARVQHFAMIFSQNMLPLPIVWVLFRHESYGYVLVGPLNSIWSIINMYRTHDTWNLHYRISQPVSQSVILSLSLIRVIVAVGGSNTHPTRRRADRKPSGSYLIFIHMRVRIRARMMVYYNFGTPFGAIECQSRASAHVRALLVDREVGQFVCGVFSVAFHVTAIVGCDS